MINYVNYQHLYEDANINLEYYSGNKLKTILKIFYNKFIYKARFLIIYVFFVTLLHFLSIKNIFIFKNIFIPNALFVQQNKEITMNLEGLILFISYFLTITALFSLIILFIWFLYTAYKIKNHTLNKLTKYFNRIYINNDLESRRFYTFIDIDQSKHNKLKYACRNDFFYIFDHPSNHDIFDFEYQKSKVASLSKDEKHILESLCKDPKINKKETHAIINSIILKENQRKLEENFKFINQAKQANQHLAKTNIISSLNEANIKLSESYETVNSIIKNL